jgi:2-polyprenyl-6-methoxyphenol hydroxylase-like FAD-dependent oxidoreductase
MALTQAGTRVGIRTGIVRTASDVVAVTEAATGVRLTMADGTVSDEFDLVVGCDGLRSAVRQAVTRQAPSPVYSGIRILFAVAPAGTYPKVGDRCDRCDACGVTICAIEREGGRVG